MGNRREKFSAVHKIDIGGSAASRVSTFCIGIAVAKGQFIFFAQVEIKTAVDVLKHGAFDYLEKDDNTLGKVEAIINRMIDVKAHLRRTQPSVFHKVLQSLLLCGL